MVPDSAEKGTRQTERKVARERTELGLPPKVAIKLASYDARSQRRRATQSRQLEFYHGCARAAWKLS